MDIVMEDDRIIGTSMVLSVGVHAAAFLLFSFVVVLDFSTAAPRHIEVDYMGAAAEEEALTAPVILTLPASEPPAINLPNRIFAEESIETSSRHELSQISFSSGKMSFVRDYGRGEPRSNIVETGKRPQAEIEAVSLAVTERYAVEGTLASRKIIIRPQDPEYPKWAVNGSVEADAKMKVTVNPQGVVERVENLQTTGYPKMDLVASRYIKQWRFETRAFDTENETGIVSVKFRLK